MIYDVSGRAVKTLVRGPMTAGVHVVVWDGTDDSNRALKPGVYWSQLAVGDFRASRKMVILK